MKSRKGFLIRNWHILIPMVFAFIFYEGQVNFVISLFYAPDQISESIIKLIPRGGILLRAIPFGILIIVLYLLGKKIQKKLLVPVIIGGLAGIYSFWIPFLIDFYMPFYGPDPPTDGQYGFIFFFYPPLSVLYVIEGILLGLLVSLGIALVKDKINGGEEYYIKPHNRKWFLLPAVLVICLFVFLFIPWNYRNLYHRKYRNKLSVESISQEKFMEVYKRSMKTKNKKLLDLIARSNRCPESVLWDIFEFSKDSEQSSLMSDLVFNQNTPEELFYRIYEHCLPYDEKELDYPSNFILSMAAYEKDFSHVLGSLARSNNTPTDLLEKLAKSSKTDIRKYVAGNKRTPLNALNVLSEDIEHTVRQSLCYNDSISIEILLKLQVDSISSVKRAAEYRLEKMGYSIE